MGIFSSIKDAIFGRRRTPPPAAQSAGTAAGQGAIFPSGQAGAPAEQPSAQDVDVEQVLREIAEQKGNPDLNWRTSIVDLMKLLDLDSSLDNRRELATELGYTGEKNGSAEMNMWLHRRVMEELERNGGRVPASMKD